VDELVLLRWLLTARAEMAEMPRAEKRTRELTGMI
jgi:hypothetical protein